MQIVLISWRTLGASELLLLPSPFSRLGVFFPPRVVCFLAVIVVVFEVLAPPYHPPLSIPTHLLPLPQRYHSTHSLPLSAPPVWSLDSSPLSWLRWWPGLTLGGQTSGREADWELPGGRSGGLQTWGIWGIWCHFLASQLWCGLEPGLTQSEGCFFFVKGSLTLGSGDAMDLRCIAAVSGIIS